jgi:hypothetical protein
MRVELKTPFVETRPRETSRVVLTVQNTAEVIDDITVRVIGLDPTAVQADPARLPLFPGAEGTITLSITVPSAFPAGEHVLPIEVSSTTHPTEVAAVDLRLDVAVDDDVSIAVKPRTLTGGKRGEFEVLCTNRGNRAIELTLLAADNEYALKHEFEPPFVSLPAGHEVVALLRVAGRRPLIGANATRRITVTALGPDRQLDAEATFSQLPRIRRAPVTFLILAGIIGLWALLFTFAINTSLAGDPAAKEFPPRALEAIAVATGATEPVVGAAAARLDAMATGGSITGTVLAQGSDEAVGRITVEAVRQTRIGPQLATAAATDENGVYELVGLVPGRYKLRFTAPGFEDLWYPAALVEDQAVEIQVTTGNTVAGIDVTITGLPGGIVGSVDPGEAVARVPVTVTARAVVDGAVGTVVAESTTDDTNTYSLAPLPTPATYELTFSAPGYQTTTSRERIEGGQIGVANTVRLSAGEGAISGLVTSGGTPLGGVRIQASSGDQQWTTATPTSGMVGAFDLVDLPTPGTYTLTFELEGYGSETIAIALGPGESRIGLAVEMVGGTGTITGRVGSGGTGLGDVTVTVTGGPVSVSTTSLTAGDIGSFRLTGLPTPARYTLTFSADGYLSETVSVDLSSNQSASGVNVSLARALGSIGGQVLDDLNGQPVSGVEIVVTDGSQEKNTLSASSPPGEFLIGSLPRGAWSVTFSRPGFVSRTVLVLLDPGDVATITVRLTPTAATTTTTP